MLPAAEYKVDRTGWPPGPWDNEPDKLQFKTESGLPGLIVRARSGALCGYVGVPPGHPLHGKSYMDLEFGVHGGLTYSDSCRDHICHAPEPGEPDDVWWLGFDCHHGFDIAPAILALGRYTVDEHYRDIAYVRNEVERLAAQVAG